MKKIISSLFLVTVALLLGSSALAQDKKIPVEKIDSSIFSVKKANLFETTGGLQFLFSVVNNSEQESVGVEVVLSGYSKSGNLQARQTWRKLEKISIASKFSSMFDVYSGLNGSSRYTVEFLAPSQTNNLSGECESCTNDAIRACGAGKVRSVSCIIDNGTYRCEYSCSGGNVEPIF